jgi:hypothetical protein
MPEHTDHGEARVGASRSMYHFATLSSMAGAALRNTSLRRAESGEKWQMVPPGIRGAAYLLSIILANAALTSWVSRVDESPRESERGDPTGGQRSHAEGSGTTYLPTLAQRGSIL